MLIGIFREFKHKNKYSINIAVFHTLFYNYARSNVQLRNILTLS